MGKFGCSPLEFHILVHNIKIEGEGVKQIRQENTIHSVLCDPVQLQAGRWNVQANKNVWLGPHVGRNYREIMTIADNMRLNT